MSGAEPLFVKGVCYSPAPIGINAAFSYPFGDYFTKEYSGLWRRDLPLLSAMGANALRIYGWNNTADHTAFLDYAHQMGMKVMVTFYLGTATDNPVDTVEQRQNITSMFVSQVERYAGHPAVLAWSFGNELNGAWNLYLQAFNRAGDCGWAAGDESFQGGCYNFVGTTGACVKAIACVYKGFLGWIDNAAAEAHAAMGQHSHLVLSSFADVDDMITRIHDHEDSVPHLDAWGVQIYRGRDFGQGQNDFLASFADVSKKPLLVTEYGVDSYNDQCGKTADTLCYNTAANPADGFGQDEATHAEWNSNLAHLLLNHSSEQKLGSVAGGFVMAWVDEQWKTSLNVKGCSGMVKWPDVGFDSTTCDFKAHADCPSQNISIPHLCGYPLGSPFDGYVNEGYFGIMTPSLPTGRGVVAGAVDHLRPKLLYGSLRTLWAAPVPQTWLWITSGVLLFSLGLCVAAYFYWRREAARGLLLAATCSDQTPLLRGTKADQYTGL